MARRSAINCKSLREVGALVWSGAPLAIRLRLVFALLIVVASTAIAAVSPVALKLVVDALSADSGDTQSVGLFLGLYVASHWLARVLGELRMYIHAQADRRMFRELCDRLFKHVLSLPLSYHVNKQTGVVTGTLTNGLQGFQTIFQTLVLTLLPVVIELVTVTIVLISLGQTAFLSLFAIAVLCYGYAFGYGVIRTTGPARRAAMAQTEAWGDMTESILNYEAVKLFTAESVVGEKVGKALLRTECEWLGCYRTRALVGLVIATIFVVFVSLTAFYSANQVQSGGMTVGTFVLLHTYMFRIMQPVETIGYASQQLNHGLILLERLFEILRQKPECKTAQIDGPLRGPGYLEFRGVSVAYRADCPILRNITFAVRPGTTVAIVGASGAGKSTLVRLLVRFIEPDAGQILIDGTPISELALPQLRRAIAVVPQDTILFNDTIRYNIAFGKGHCTQDEVERAATLALLHDFVMSLPEKYETKVGERGIRLSGGEKQRLSIARAAIKSPLIYVFDEATSSLDSRTESEIMFNLRNIAKNHTTVLIAHRLSTVVDADQIIVLDQGSIVEQGTHVTLMHKGGRYARLWAAQQCVAEELANITARH